MKDKKIRKAIKKSNLSKKVKQEILIKFKKQKPFYDSDCGRGA